MCQYHREYAARVNANQPRERVKRWSKNGRVRLRAEILKHYGTACACCNEKRPQFLTLDHINGDGAEHRRKHPFKASGGGLHRWLKSRGFPEGYRTLCFNCNGAMGIYGVCPHGKLAPQRTNHPANPHRQVT